MNKIKQIFLYGSAVDFKILLHFIWQKVTDEDSLPETRVWSIFFIQSHFKLVWPSLNSISHYLYSETDY